VTGASGVGKTTLVHALDAQRLPGLHCHYFDSVGVPPVTDMTWQQSTTERWVTALVANDTGDRVALLEGQMRPSEVRDAALFDTTHLTLAQAEQGFIECIRAWTVWSTTPLLRAVRTTMSPSGRFPR
jgi:hypothetical protein